MGRIKIYRRVPPGEVLDLLDRRALFSARWGYRPISQRQRLELESKLAAMLSELSDPKNWSAGAVWGAFDAQLNENGLQLAGTGSGTSLGLIAARLPYQLMRSFKRRGAVVLQAVTLGAKAARLAKKRRSISERLLWHGLAAEAAEALADWCSRRAADEMGWDEYGRISPGFPAWPELSEQRELFRLIRPSRIGLRLSGSCQMTPEYSTSSLNYAI